MRSQDDVDSIFLFYEFLKIPDVLTGRIPDDHSGGKVDKLRPVFLHFCGYVFDIPSRASPACRIPHDLYFFAFMDFESPFVIPRSSEAFPPAAIPITIANDNPDFDLFHSLHLLFF